MMQGSLLSNIPTAGPPHDRLLPTLGFNGATFGNHEFDWGQTVLGDRIAQAEAVATADEKPMQMITSNITKKDAGGACTWEPFNPNDAIRGRSRSAPRPMTSRSASSVSALSETPYITIAEATEGLCFRDPAESILHYYDALEAAELTSSSS